MALREGSGDFLFIFSLTLSHREDQTPEQNPQNIYTERI